MNKEIAMAMYALIKEFGSADLAFKNQDNSEFEPEDFIILDKELKRLRREFNNCFKSGVFEVASDVLDANIVLNDMKTDWVSKIPTIKESGFEDVLSETIRIKSEYEFIKSGKYQIGTKNVEYEDTVIEEPVFLKPENIGCYVTYINSDIINVKEFIKTL